LAVGFHALFCGLARLGVEAADAVHVERREVRARAIDVHAMVAQVVFAWACHPPTIVAVVAVIVPHRVRVGVVAVDVVVVSVVAMEVARR
jgi:hypothetical protein